MEPKKSNLPKQKFRSNSIDGFVAPSHRRPVVHKPLSSRQFPGRSVNLERMPKTASESQPTNPRPLHPNQQAGSILNTTLPSNLNNLPSRSRKSSDKKHRKWTKKKIILMSSLAVVILGLGLGGWDAWQLYHKLHHIAVNNLTASVGGAENILVAGSTNRCNLKVQNAQWGFCSQGVTGVNSDVIFVVHLVPATHTVSLLSIPRDTFVPNARSGNQAFKVDAALYQGPSQLVNTIEQNFGIPIQHYMEVGFDGFVNIVNAVGGIKMDFPMPVYDSESYLNIKTPGCYLLNGVQALQVIRARHLQYKPASITTNDTYYWPQEAASDIARINRTHEFLRVLASSVVAKGVSNPVTDQKLVDAIAPQVQVDSGFSTSTMLSLVQAFKSVNINNVPQYTLPIATTGFGSYDYEGTDMGDVVFPVEPNDHQIINKFLGVGSSTNIMTGENLPSPSSVSVNVINGSGQAGQASDVSNGLSSLGFNIASQPGSATPVSTQAQETYVYYANTSSEGDALAVLQQLNGYVILANDPSMVTSGSDVTVVTGTGVTVNAPPTSSSTSTSSSSSSNGSASSTSSASTQPSTTTQADIAAPSSATQSLSAWDPRACTSNQPLVN